MFEMIFSRSAFFTLTFIYIFSVTCISGRFMHLSPCYYIILFLRYFWTSFAATST